MNLITKDKLESFIEYYHGFHDSTITNINYDIKLSKIELFMNVYWSGKPTLKEDGSYETNKTKIRMTFNKVRQCSNKDNYKE